MGGSVKSGFSWTSFTAFTALSIQQALVKPAERANYGRFGWLKTEKTDHQRPIRLTDHNMPTATTRPNKECFHLLSSLSPPHCITCVCIFIFKRPTSLSFLIFLCLHIKVKLPLFRKLCYAVGGVPYQMTNIAMGFSLFLLDVQVRICILSPGLRKYG